MLAGLICVHMLNEHLCVQAMSSGVLTGGMEEGALSGTAKPTTGTLWLSLKGGGLK